MSGPAPARSATGRLLGHLAALSGGETLSKAVAFVAFAYLARVLAPEAYGYVEIAVSLSLFFTLVIDFGLGAIGAREVSRESARRGELAAAIPTLRLGLALLAVPAMLLAGLALGLPPEARWLAGLFALGLLAVPFNQRWLLQGLEMMGWVSAGQAVRMTVFALGVLALVRAPDDLLVVGAVEVAAAFALALYFLAVQGARVAPIRLRLSGVDWRRLLGQGAPVGLGQVAWALNQYLPTLLVAGLVGGAEVGWFGAAHRVALSLATFSWVYHFNLFPAVARRLAESPAAYGELVRPSFRLTAWGGVAVGLVGTLLAEPVCRLAFGDAFAVAGAPLAVLVWTVPLTLLSGHARWALIAAGEQRFVLLAQVAGALTTLGLGLALVPAHGALGAACAMVASLLVLWSVAHLAVRRRVAPVPALAVGRPLLAAALAAALGRALGSPWAGAALAAAVYAAVAPLLEPRLLGDVGRLAGARERGLPAHEEQEVLP